MNNLRNNKGRFRRSLTKIYITVIIASFLVVVGGEKVMEWAEANEPIVIERIVEVDSNIIQLMKEDLVNNLRLEESGGRMEDGRLLYTNDPRQSMKKKCNKIGGVRDINCDSWGVMQFKIPTVIDFYDRLYGKEITEVEALLIALDEQKALKLAEDMIFEIEGAIWNWENSVNKKRSYYLQQIPFIRSLENI